MQVEGPQTPYEVFCPRCQVSFPVETRKCIHCGGRLAKHRFKAGMEPPPNLDEVIVDEELPRRSGLSPYTLVWVALLLAGYLYRACTNA